jgi:hypothetical protein
MADLPTIDLFQMMHMGTLARLYDAAEAAGERHEVTVLVTGPDSHPVAAIVPVNLESMGGRILPEFGQVDGDSMRAAIMIALGAASVCWQDVPHGAFLTEQASKLGDELMGIAAQYAAAMAEASREGSHG